MHRSPRFSFIHLAVAVLAFSANDLRAEGTPFLDGYAGFQYDDNVPGAELSSERFSDFSALFGVSYAYGKELSDTSGYLLRGALEVQRFERFRELSNVSLKTSMDYRWVASNDLLAPWFRGTINAGYTETYDSEIRDGWRVSLESTVGMRLTHIIEAHLGYIYDYRSALHGTTFDLHGHRLQAGVRYDLDSSKVLYLRGYQRHGGATSSGVIGTPEIRIVRRAVEPDPVFGSGANSWRIEGVTRSIEVGADISIDDNNIIDVSAFYARTEGKLDVSWDKYGMFLLYSHSFF